MPGGILSSTLPSTVRTCSRQSGQLRCLGGGAFHLLCHLQRVSLARPSRNKDTSRGSGGWYVACSQRKGGQGHCLHRAAEDGVDIRDGHIAVDVDAISAQSRVVPDTNEDVDVSRLATAAPSVALPAHTQP